MEDVRFRVFLLLDGSLSNNYQKGGTKVMERISIDQLHDEIIPNMGPEDLILDVRTPEEYAEGHIKGSRNQDHEAVAGIAEELKNYSKVYVHCKMGGRAQRAAEALDIEGLDNIVCVSDGGMHRWIEMGWEVE